MSKLKKNAERDRRGEHLVEVSAPSSDDAKSGDHVDFQASWLVRRFGLPRVFSTVIASLAFDNERRA